MYSSLFLPFLYTAVRCIRAAPLAGRDEAIYIESGEVILGGPATITTAPSLSDLRTAAISQEALPTATQSPSPQYQAVLTTFPIATAEDPAFVRTKTVFKVDSPKGHAPTPLPTRLPATATLQSWSLPSDFGSDLSADFEVETWAWGSSLVTVLPSLPSKTSSASVGPQNLTRPSTTPSANTGPVMQVTYPKDSVNPGGHPQGGVGFYAQPSKYSQKFPLHPMLMKGLQSILPKPTMCHSHIPYISHRTLILCKLTRD